MADKKKFTNFDNELESAFKGSMRKASQGDWVVDCCPTGIYSIDAALGGGFGYGSVSEIFGNYSSGKSLVLLYALHHNATKMKGAKSGKPGRSFLFENENRLNTTFLKEIGVDPDVIHVEPVNTV
jgi:RecA/RadA recombinase